MPRIFNTHLKGSKWSPPGKIQFTLGKELHAQWVGPEAGLDAVKKRKKPPEEDSCLLRNYPLLVTIPTFRRGMLPSVFRSMQFSNFVDPEERGCKGPETTNNLKNGQEVTC